MAKNKKQKRIIQGGLREATSPQTHTPPTVVLQMPEVFMIDLRKFQNAYLSALSIDYPSRVRLYDIYKSAELDLHLSGVIDKRLRGVTQIPIEFHRDGKADELITPQLKSPWFKDVRKEIILAEFWGFSLMQFYLDEEGNIRADSIDRKHYNPINREILRYQGDERGTPIEEFPNMLFVGKERSLGILAELMIAVLYKRGNISDWAKFCNIFGIPIREYTYDAGDEEARKNTIRDARLQGSSAVYIHPKESQLNIIEPQNTSANGQLFREFTEYWDKQMSIRVLGNTLTTDSQNHGTQALGEVHKEVEDEMNADDRDSILDTLNYYMRPIFTALGFNCEGGEFVYAKKDKTNPTQQVDIVLKLHSIGLPIADDYMYEFSGIPKPENYDAMLAEKKAEREALSKALELTTEPSSQEDEDDDTPKGNTPPKPSNSIINKLRSFFGLAPLEGADNDF